MDAFLAFVMLAAFGLFPLLSAACFATLARRILASYNWPASRWVALPLFLLGFATTAFLVAGVTLTFRPDDKPRLLNPVLVFMVLDGLLLLPVAAGATVRGILLIRTKRFEAGLNFAAASAYGLLYLPLAALDDYFPHV